MNGPKRLKRPLKLSMLMTREEHRYLRELSLAEGVPYAQTVRRLIREAYRDAQSLPIHHKEEEDDVTAGGNPIRSHP